ncbi:hypothetical protein MTsPCn5_03290 [Croceitalea sp. MTPC5]|uniref:hypothetical protein n=1 Tax=Croceitalea sp. MTPC5 TaxID=3056565 RepID=UPI002B3BF481|nr:hypothetical protein MTsPCn5_03290 [Croceitalea sp. MTPC5]
MSNHNDINSDQNGQNDLVLLNGLHKFQKSLERDFYADSLIKTVHGKGDTTELVLELDCNFSLTESLFHLNNGNWGSYDINTSNVEAASPFETALFDLSRENHRRVDIKELTINLKDTSLIVTKIFDYSIPDQLGNILASISENFVHFTKALTEMPYEIFVPIFEESQPKVASAVTSTKKSKTDYFDFWGLYFESNIDAVVYDLKSRTIIDESDFFLLNQ